MQRFSKRHISFVLWVFILFAACKKTPEQIYSDINKHYNEINSKLKDYKTKKTEDIVSKGLGDVMGYYRDDEVKKIESQYFFDTCRSFAEYYFDDGFLILIIKKNYVYNRPQSYTEAKAKSLGDSVWYDDKKTQLETDSFFFHQNHLIKWVGSAHEEVKPTSATFIDKESLLWAETKLLLMQLKAEG